MVVVLHYWSRAYVALRLENVIDAFRPLLLERSQGGFTSTSIHQPFDNGACNRRRLTDKVFIRQAIPKENRVVDQRMVEKENKVVDYRWFSVEHVKWLSDVEESLRCKGY